MKNFSQGNIINDNASLLDALKARLVDMMQAAISGAKAVGSAEMVIDHPHKKYERLPHVLPDEPCIYLYAVSQRHGAKPCAVYIGQSDRNVYYRLLEHRRSARHQAEIYLKQAWENGGEVRILAMTVPILMLNDLERYGLQWLMKHAGIDILNTAPAGGNSKVPYAKTIAHKSYTLYRPSDLGTSSPCFLLNNVAKELDAYENALSDDELKEVDKIAKTVMSLQRKSWGLQVVSTRPDGSLHIEAGIVLMLAARRSGHDIAFGPVIQSNWLFRKNDPRLKALAMLMAKQLYEDLPVMQKSMLVATAYKQYVRLGFENSRTGTHFHKVDGIIRLLVSNSPKRHSSIQSILTHYRLAEREN